MTRTYSRYDMLVLEIQVADVDWNKQQWRITTQEPRFCDVHGGMSILFGDIYFRFNTLACPEFYLDAEDEYSVYLRGHDKEYDNDWISNIEPIDLDRLLSALRLLTNRLYNSNNKEIVVDGEFYRFYI